MQSPLGFRFATAASLVDREGYTGEEAEHLLREWERYARYAMMSGKSPASTAEHLARFERYQTGALLQRDPHTKKTSASLSLRSGRTRPRSLLRRVPEADVDAVIADDLRRRATMIYDDDPEHAQRIFEVARMIQSERDPSIDKAYIAAEALSERDALTTEERRHLPDSTFALPQRRALPVHDASHARNAAARLEQMRERENVSPAEYMQAFERIHRAEEEFGIVSKRDVAREPRCPRGTEIVSLIFPSGFTEHEVRAWTREHGFKSDSLEFPRTTGSIRATQRNPDDFTRGSFRTIVLNERDNIRAVIGCPRAGRESDKRKRSPPPREPRRPPQRQPPPRTTQRRTR